VVGHHQGRDKAALNDFSQRHLSGLSTSVVTSRSQALLGSHKYAISDNQKSKVRWCLFSDGDSGILRFAEFGGLVMLVLRRSLERRKARERELVI
jgi:hypothetical protein